MGVNNENFLCVCGGTYMVDLNDKQFGLKVFRCDMCLRFALECPVCLFPRTIFVRNFERCKICDDNFASLKEIFKAIIKPAA